MLKVCIEFESLFLLGRDLIIIASSVQGALVTDVITKKIWIEHVDI